MGNVIKGYSNDVDLVVMLHKLNDEEVSLIYKKVKSVINSDNISKINSLLKTHELLKDKLDVKKHNKINTLLKSLSNTNNIENMLRIFKLKPVYTNQELERSYKKLIFKYHPDRPTGNIDKFKLIQSFYEVLLTKNKLKVSDKQHRDLKNNSHDYIKNQKHTNFKNIKLKKFDSDVFNSVFAENYKEDSYGHGDWMKEKRREKRNTHNPNNKLISNFNNTDFNIEFNNNTTSNEIVEYTVPESIVSHTSITPSELGKKSKNFTTNNHSDVKEAFSTKRMNGVYKKPETDNIDILKKNRTNPIILTNDNKKALDEYNLKKHTEELDRQIYMKQVDKQNYNNYIEMNSKMLEHGLLRK